MTMFIMLDNGEPKKLGPVTAENMKYLFPHIDFDYIVTPEMVAPLGFGVYEFTMPPDRSLLGRYQKVVDGIPKQRKDGIYYQQHIIVNMTLEEKTTVDAVRTNWALRERIEYLLHSDYTQIPDAPLTEEQKAAFRIYRQELRDLPTHPDWPWDMPWPTPPLPIGAPDLLQPPSPPPEPLPPESLPSS